MPRREKYLVNRHAFLSHRLAMNVARLRAVHTGARQRVSMVTFYDWSDAPGFVVEPAAQTVAEPCR